MDYDLSPEQKALRDKVREALQDAPGPDLAGLDARHLKEALLSWASRLAPSGFLPACREGGLGLLLERSPVCLDGIIQDLMRLNNVISTDLEREADTVSIAKMVLRMGLVGWVLTQLPHVSCWVKTQPTNCFRLRRCSSALCQNSLSKSQLYYFS